MTPIRSLRFKLLGIGLTIALLVIALIVQSSLRLLQNSLLEQTQVRMAAMEVAYKTAVVAPLATRDYASLRDIFDGWRVKEDIVYIAATDQQGRLLAISGLAHDAALPEPSSALDPAARLHHVRFDIDVTGQTLGKLQYGLSLDFLKNAQRALVQQSLIIAALAVLLTSVLIGFAAHRLSRRIEQLAEASSRIAAGEYDNPVETQGNDEVALLAKNFQDMARAVQTRVHELRFQARHDSLTGLHNRHAFEIQLEQLLAEREKAPVFVLYIDLDQFKSVNDSCGHFAGDMLLQQVAAFLMKQREIGFVARLGGDEFALLIVGGDDATTLGHARTIIAGIRAIDFIWEGQNFGLGASIGIARASETLDTVTALLMGADSACYAAKERGRHRAEFYREDDDWYRHRLSEFEILPRISEALATDQFVLYHQRIHPLCSTCSPSAEVLVRMRDADGTLVSPGLFIPAAERFNLMPFLDRWVLDHTLRQMAIWRTSGRGMPFHHLAINLSGGTLNDPDLLRYLREKLAEHAVSPRQLCFEITESAAIANPDHALAFIHEVRSLGASVSLDDFGSGLSSFGYLKKFDVDYLKIDGQFVKNLDSDAMDRAVVEAMVKLARAHGLQTVAEYVTSLAIEKEVLRLGVDFAQGFAIHQPSPLADL